jgi:hypothetical protein
MGRDPLWKIENSKIIGDRSELQLDFDPLAVAMVGNLTKAKLICH